METVDKRFVLVADNGDRLYPYKKSQKSTGRYGFALTEPGEQDRHGQGTYTDNIAEVINRVVNDGWKVRAKTINQQRGGSIGLNKRSVHGYEIAEEFEHLVQAAVKKPLSILRTEKQSATKPKETSEALQLNQEHPVDDVTLKAIKTRRGQPEFRKALLSYFDGRCCITECAIEGVLEAAHIVPHSIDSNYSVSNGLLLRSDIHTLYDLNLIGIDETGRVFISSSLKESEYWKYNGLVALDSIQEIMSNNLKQRFQFMKK
ncbi:HNH endonuclease [Pokkaliibacter sp. CJK22405]|uniref:HNH endonuclease n=1 Tax=Pokkaliibacter sp. CJK22405 TaxID=3384615 RepID=UPI0039853225